jgi:hypothetical protein
VCPCPPEAATEPVTFALSHPLSSQPDTLPCSDSQPVHVSAAHFLPREVGIPERWGSQPAACPECSHGLSLVLGPGGHWGKLQKVKKGSCHSSSMLGATCYAVDMATELDLQVQWSGVQDTCSLFCSLCQPQSHTCASLWLYSSSVMGTESRGAALAWQNDFKIYL